MTWYWIVAAVVAVVLLGLWMRALATRTGMSKSVSGRTGQLGAVIARSAIRKLELRIKQLLASREEKQRLESQYHMQSAEEAAKAMGQMKGVFMKIGQIISFTNENLPPAARDALAKLQQDAPPMAYSLVKEVIEKELGKPVEEIFKSLDHEPLAAASIGQVHKGVLHDGREVVMKVQYPGVDEAIQADLKASGGLVAMIGAFSKNMDAKSMVAELKEIITQELDYERELKNQQLFYELWEDHPMIHVPEPYPEFSGKRVLCQEFRRGMRFSDFLEHSNEREKSLAVRVLFDFVFESMYRYCVFNGDPHPGNYLFHEDGSITFLDFGCIKYFEPSFIHELKDLSRSLIEGDKAAFEKMCLQTKMVIEGNDYDIDKVWEFMSYNMDYIRRDETFAFTKEWIQKASEMVGGEYVREINLPPDMIFFNRITFGLNSIFLRLGARDNFHCMNRRYLYPHEGRLPALADLGMEIPGRYLSSDVEPAPRLAGQIERTSTEQVPAGKAQTVNV